MLDKDLAEIYEVETRVLLQAIKRNHIRFPIDFVFQLTDMEAKSLTSQIVISKIGRGGRRHLPYVFTEHGVAMLSSVLRSERAVQMNIFIIRAFIKIREILSLNKDLAQKVKVLEHEQIKQGKVITLVYSTLKNLEKEPLRSEEPMGFDVTK